MAKLLKYFLLLLCLAPLSAPAQDLGQSDYDL
jgi:hypothetical protein